VIASESQFLYVQFLPGWFPNLRFSGILFVAPPIQLPPCYPKLFGCTAAPRSSRWNLIEVLGRSAPANADARLLHELGCAPDKHLFSANDEEQSDSFRFGLEIGERQDSDFE
jgi:hypothetical protein